MPTELPDKNRRDLFPGDSEMARRMREFNWSETPLGPVEGWSPVLQTTLRIMLANRFPHILWWGPEFIQFYNDPYIPIPGDKHPQKALGRPGRECWSEIWHVIGPLAEGVYRGGPATWEEDIELDIQRHGFAEETHFTIAYSPVLDEAAPNGIGGVLATVHEITGKVVGDRRVRLLRDLGARSAEARTAKEACAMAAEVLGRYAKDIPFALLYLIDADREAAVLGCAAGVAEGQPISPVEISLKDDESEASWPLGRAKREQKIRVVADLANRLGGQLAPGLWSGPPYSAAVAPIRSNRAHQLAGFLVAGISPRLRFDEQYADFLNLVSTQLSTAIASAREYEEERKRAEALAEIDRAKTVFFSNVSHEFRTPLTLMLAPLEDELREHPGVRNVEIAHRNALRLLKLVNSLLDFSRIEAGRMEAAYEPTDLGGYTAELASVFRSAIEKAGLRLTVECPPLGEPVYVDREMWEKIVLNLLSNALKFTFEGDITVGLRKRGGQAELTVSDAGVGIREAELPRIFERFYRIRGTRSRTHEGTGIGLALVKELVTLHGGTIEVTSAEGRGATFVVSIPFGIAHLPKDRIRTAGIPSPAALGAMPFLEEAWQWLPGRAEKPGVTKTPASEEPVPFAPAVHSTGESALIVLADDNADMRDYLYRLLSQEHDVVAVADGEAALAAVRERRPDLVLADVMMPGLDGYSLMERLRADPQTSRIPFILLSARAGEEARVEGLRSGADDYLIKPFSARELLARINTALKLARLRRDAEEVLRHSNGELERLVGERTRELEDLNQALRRIEHAQAHELDTAHLLWQEAMQLMDSQGIETLYEQILDTAMELMRSDFASIKTFYPERGNGGQLRLISHRGYDAETARRREWVSPDSHSVCGEALRTRKSVFVRDIRNCDFLRGSEELEVFRAAGILAVQTTPLFSHSGVLLGMVSTHWHEPHELMESDLRAFAVLARLAADLIERSRTEGELLANEAKLQTDLQALTARLVELQESGMKELSRELHDHLTQKLAALAMELSTFTSTSADLSPMLAHRIRAIRMQLENLATDVHSISRRLHPSILDDLGLDAALREECRDFSAKTGVPVQFECEGWPRLGADVSLCFYRIAQEGLHNIIKHACATDVRVTLVAKNDNCSLRIEDNGRGLDLHGIKWKKALGLISMQERARLVNGSFMIWSEAGEGTTLEVSVVCKADSHISAAISSN